MELNLEMRLVVFIILKRNPKVAFSTCFTIAMLIFFSGSDCYELFKTMQNCMQNYPTLYNKDLADDDDFSSMDSDKKEISSTSESPAKADKNS